MSRWGYFLRRLVLAIPVVVFGTTITFMLVRLGPIDPAAAIVGIGNPQGIARIREQLGLTQPLWQQYFDFMINMFTFDLGQSWVIQPGRDAYSLIVSYAPRTIWLGIWSVLIALVVGIPLGFYAGLNPNTFGDPSNPYTHALLSAIPEANPGSDKQRITLRGTPPSPRDPPTGCPFSTRCPAKIRPEKYRDTDDDLWERIEVFREVLRERGRAERSLSERARALLGMETRFSDVEEMHEELFGDVQVPEEIQTHLDEVEGRLRDNDEAGAIARLREEFGSECDTEMPDHHEVSGTGRMSLCHRHKDGIRGAERVLRPHYTRRTING
jgi:oligopeptide/dipeptide ABC transporter ATP-binding protein